MIMSVAALQSVRIATARASVADATPAARSAARVGPKVLHITPSIGGGGAEAMLCNLVAEMRGGAWRSVVVSINGSAWPERAAELERQADAYYDLGAFSFLSPSVWRRIVDIVREEKPDVVQTWMHHADLVGGVCARFASVKHVVWGIHCREIHANEGESWLRRAAFRAALGLCSHMVPERIVSCSSAAIRDHKGMGYPTQKMTWIPNGISTERFTPEPTAQTARRVELGLEPDGPVIGFVGRFHEMKRLDWLFDAASLLMRKCPHAQLLLCGGEARDLDGAAAAAFAKLPDPARVHFIPFRADIQRIYAAMSVFTLTSRTEACPMTVIEAMASGIPCVTTDVGDCARLIEEPGAVVPVGDIAALAAAWERVIALDPACRAALGARLRRRAVERLSVRHAARGYEALYQSLLGNSTR